MKITIKPVASAAFSVELASAEEATVADLKEAASESGSAGTAEASRIKLVFRGHVLKDAESVSGVGIQEGSTVHMVLTKAPPAAEAAMSATAVPSSASSPAATAAANPFSLPDPSASAFSPASMASNPIFQSMVSNPDLMLQMAEANPSLRALLDAGGPELRAALRDPNTLRQAAAAAADPAVAREAARNADRALAGMEAHPEGFQMLRRLQAQMQAAEAEAAGGEEGGNGGNATTTGTAPAAAGGPPNSNPLPNPWAPSALPSSGGAGAGAGAAGSLPDLSSLLSMFGGAAGGAASGAAAAPNPPSDGGGLASLFSNPALLQAALASDPRLRSMVESNPGMRELMADPGFMQRTAGLAAQLFGGGGGAGGAAGAAGGIPDLAQLASMLGGGVAAGGAGGAGALAALLAGAGAGGAGNEEAPFSLPPVADPETAFATQLSQLEAMGFVDRRASIAALQATGGNVEAAVERLLR